MGGEWRENMRMLRGIEKQIVPLLHALGNTEWEWKWRIFTDSQHARRRKTHTHKNKTKTHDRQIQAGGWSGYTTSSGTETHRRSAGSWLSYLAADSVGSAEPPGAVPAHTPAYSTSRTHSHAVAMTIGSGPFVCSPSPSWWRLAERETEGGEKNKRCR